MELREKAKQADTLYKYNQFLLFRKQISQIKEANERKYEHWCKTFDGILQSQVLEKWNIILRKNKDRTELTLARIREENILPKIFVDIALSRYKQFHAYRMSKYSNIWSSASKSPTIEFLVFL